MAWSVTINGNLYTDASFEPYAYRESFPLIFADLASAFSGMSAQYTIANSNYQAFLTAVAAGPVVGVNGLTGAVALASPNQRIINGDFRVAQRGASGSTASGTIYVADRWAVFVAGSTGTVTVAQSSTPELVLGENISASLQLTIPAGSGFAYLSQRVEDVRTFGGLRGVLNVLVWSATATTIDRIDITRSTGTGGTGSDNIGRFSNVAVSAGWNKLQIPFVATDLTGKTITSDSYVQFSVQAKNNISSDAKTLRFGRIWIDDSNGAQSPTGGRFGERPLQIEQALSERYYERIGVDYAAYASAAGQQIVIPVAFGNRKAKSPALTFAAAGTLTNCTAALAASSDPTGGAKLTLTATAAGLVSIAGAIVAADAEI